MKTCPCTRTILAGVIFGFIYHIIGGIVWGGVFKESTMAYAHLWRPMTDQWMSLGMPLAGIVMGIGFAHAFRKLYGGLCSKKSPAAKGACFGTTLWFAFGLGGALCWFSFTPVSYSLLAAHLIHTALGFVLGGAAIGFVFGSLLDKECEEMCEMKKSPKKEAPKKKKDKAKAKLVSKKSKPSAKAALVKSKAKSKAKKKTAAKKPASKAKVIAGKKKKPASKRKAK